MNGEMKVYNFFTSREDFSFSANNFRVRNLEYSNEYSNEELLLSSVTMGKQKSLTTLWAITNQSTDLK